MNLTQKQRKLITSLQQKKYRNQHKLFVAEGIKVIQEFLDSSFELDQLFVTTKNTFSSYNPTLISENELKRVSSLKSPNKALGLFKIPVQEEVDAKGLILALDSINDPGNLGTIIRLCDWFGIETLLCSYDTVDCYNTKVVQSSMGSLTRVKIHYTDLVSEIDKMNLPVFIADMDGENVYTSQLPKDGILVMGNEANGISDEIKKMTNEVLSIPRFGNLQQTESLNVATATAILLSEFRRF